MKNIFLDGKNMNSKISAHKYIRYKLDLPNYYGNNLDSLWDFLTQEDALINITLTNQDLLIDNLGDYGLAIIKVFKDASSENKNIRFHI